MQTILLTILKLVLTVLVKPWVEAWLKAKSVASKVKKIKNRNAIKLKEYEQSGNMDDLP